MIRSYKHFVDRKTFRNSMRFMAHYLCNQKTHLPKATGHSLQATGIVKDMCPTDCGRGRELWGLCQDPDEEGRTHISKGGCYSERWRL